MPVNKRVLTETYGAYLNREVPDDDRELTRVGPGTPCGEYLRRFWQPICFAEDLKDVPNRIRILGEDLVVFRDGRGRVGLLQLHCSHRGTSLEFGRIAHQGIRCCYHGWLYDIDGRILETPGEPRNSKLKDRHCHGAYPTIEFEGLVFTYMGPPAKRPTFPILDTYRQPGVYHVPWRHHPFPCNWLQVKENCLDLMHNVFLHARVAGPHFTEAFAEFPELEWQYTPDGALCVQTRRVKDNVWVRMNDFILPNMHQFPPSDDAVTEKLFVRALCTVWDVPIDDTNTLHIGIMHLREGERPDSPDIDNAANFGMNDNRPYRERQLLPGDYEAQVGQRPIAIHALETLGATDRGIAMLRRLVREGIRAVEQGDDPQGWERRPDEVIQTHSQNTVLRIPPAATDETDRELLRATGREILARN